MTIVYFAWLRDKIGTATEPAVPPVEVATVGELMDWLAARSPGHAAAFADRSAIRAAVDHQHVAFDAAIEPGCEVAFFPPVTGG